MTLATLSPYNEDRTTTLGERAVVAGGSVAGLCTARALADYFGEVVVLERDALPEEPTVRDGAPQTGQPHALLEGGRRVVEQFFPGFGADVLAAGGLELDFTEDLTWYDYGGVIDEADAELLALYASRPVFEHLLRQRLRDRPDVVVRDERTVTGYQHDASAGRVTGVEYRSAAGEEDALDAALVVDATGRSSRTPRWLEANGYPVPDTDEVTVDVTYSTVHVDRPSDEAWCVLISPEPHRPRGAAMLPAEDGRWEVLLQGIHGEQAPADRERFLAWADQLPLDVVADQLREREWRSEPRRYPFPASVRRHYAALDRFPDGLVVTGDAVASFNPVYGQGMSVAAMEALSLHHELAAGLESIGPRFFHGTEDLVDDAWSISVGRDFTYDATTGPKPTGVDLANGYTKRLIQRAHDDPALATAFLRVVRLEEPPTHLARPGVLWRVFRPRFGG